MNKSHPIHHGDDLTDGKALVDIPVSNLVKVRDAEGSNPIGLGIRKQCIMNIYVEAVFNLAERN